MAVTKSIIENFELTNGVEIYVQASHSGHISLSFDGQESSYQIRLTANEAEKLAEKLGVVVQEQANE